MPGPEAQNVKVVVLGDFGRSPRMQYHSLSLAEAGHRVDVIAYGETDPMEPIKTHPSILYHYLIPVPQLPVKIINYAFKTIFQALNLLFLLFVTAKSDVLIVQNPPAIPTLFVCWIYTTVVRAKLILDWHNYAHTIMALSVGEENILVKITRSVEAFIGRKAQHNFCVTRALKEDLKSKWGITAAVLYDRPPKIFRPITIPEKHEFFIKLSSKYPDLLPIANGNSLFTESKGDEIILKESRPGLIVSSTSWTEDEDFSVLLSALTEYEEHCNEGNVRNLPKLICVITGKGPLKSFYLSKIQKLEWKHVTVITPWLESEDYPLMLAAADLGVSLHTSSSGLDLPMKVVDMFGCGLPVCAYDFKCLNELVKHGENSYTFKTPQELSELILNWFEDFPNNLRQKQSELNFKTELELFQNLRWTENWKAIAASYFEKHSKN